MKEIYVLRHAKSSWDNSNLSDFERPLSDRGISDAKKMSKFLKDMDLKIDKVLCSNALRAKETFDLTADGFNFEIDKYSSIEGQIANICDDIAYVSHDLEDGLRSKIIKIKDLINLPTIDFFLQKFIISEEISYP